MPRTKAVSSTLPNLSNEQVIALCLEYESVHDGRIDANTQFKGLPLGLMFKRLMGKYYRGTIPMTTARAMLAIRTVFGTVTKQPYFGTPEHKIKFLRSCRENGINPRKQKYNGYGGQTCINWLRRHYDSLSSEQQKEVDILCKPISERTTELYQLTYEYESYYGALNHRTVYKGKEIGRFIFRQIAKCQQTKDDKYQTRLEKSITYTQRQTTA